MWITDSYIGTLKGNVRCLFFLLHEDYIEAQRGLPDKVNQELERFSRNMGKFGALVKPFNGDVEHTRASVLDKPWTNKELNIVSKTPSLLMIDQDFDEFDPRTHRWIVLNLDGEQGDPAKFRSLIQKVLDAIPDADEDPFKFIEKAIKESEVDDFSEVFQIKPGAFGMSLDLKLAWKKLKPYLRNKSASESN